MKERNKKIILLSIIIIVTCISCFIVIHLLNKKLEPKTLKGELITDNIYHYTVKRPNDYVPIKIINDTIYTLTEDNNIYTLNKRDIYNADSIVIGTIENEDFCSFDETYIICSRTDQEVDYYDYDLNVIFNRTYNQTDYTEAFYYQGKFLTLKGNKIYDNDTLIRELDIDSNTFLSDSYILGNNTYLKFYSRNEVLYINYDFQNDRYTKIFDPLWTKYNEGYYSSFLGEIKVYNLLTDEYKEYTDLELNDNLLASTINNNIIYYINNNQLYSQNLDTKEINIYEYIYNDTINQMTYDNNYLYLVTNNNDFEIYLLDINKLSKETYTQEEYKLYVDNIIDTKVKELENKYNINIVYKDEVNIDNYTFKTTVMDNNNTILKSLTTLEKILAKFNKEFFDQFHDEEHNGVTFYLAGQLIPNSEANTTSFPIGYTLTENDQFEIVLDIRSYQLDETVCHELMHNIEFRMDKDIYQDWFDLNPLYFEYMYTYIVEPSSDFTRTEENPNLVYFIERYSKSYPTEDVATIFENICKVDNNSIVNDYPHLYEKAIYLKETLEAEYPSLKEATVFNSLKPKEKID